LGVELSNCFSILEADLDLEGDGVAAGEADLVPNLDSALNINTAPSVARSLRSPVPMVVPPTGRTGEVRRLSIHLQNKRASKGASVPGTANTTMLPQPTQDVGVLPGDGSPLVSNII
jgi:hypothetical protein